MTNLSSKTGFTPNLTQISLANNAATTIQNMSAYDGQLLTGFVYVDATTDYRAFCVVQVIKNGAGTYEVAASDVSGDDLSGSPIVTFAMSGTNLQATLPNFTGFTSAYIRFKLDAPALGAQFPLQVSSDNVSFTDIKAATSGGLNFKEDGGTNYGSMSDLGAWLFPANREHIFGQNANVGTNQADLTLHAGSLGQSVFRMKRAGSTKLSFYADVSVSDTIFIDSGSGNIAKATQAGSFTLGSSANSSNIGHFIEGGSGNVTLKVQTTNAGASAAGLQLKNSAGASNDVFEMVHGAGVTKLKDGAGTVIGQVDLTSAGSWLFGSTGGTALHRFYGYVGIGANPSASYKLHCAGNQDYIARFQQDDTTPSGTNIIHCDFGGTNDASGGNALLITDSGGAIGSISVASATTVAYNTSSDERLKTNPQEFDANNIISLLKPKKFQWIKDGKEAYGLYAQEAFEVFPDAVKVGSDISDPWQIDYSKYVPVLIKAIQEQQAIIEQLKSRIEDLENN